MPIQPSSNVTPSNYTTQSGSAYPLNIDGNTIAGLRIAGNFAPRVESTPNMMMSVDPGHLFTDTAPTELGTWSLGNVNSNTTINVTGPLSGIAVGQRVTAYAYVSGVLTEYLPVGTIVTNVAGSTITVSQNANATATGVVLVFGQAIGGICTGNTNSNTTLNGLQSTAHMFVGMQVAGTGIPNGTTISSINSSSSVTLSQAATSTNTGVVITTTVPAPSTNPRTDRVVVNQATGAASWIEGTPNASPTPPNVPSGYSPVCQVAVLVATTAITMTSNITDERDLSSLGVASGSNFSPPTGRLTLTSGEPVMTADNTGTGTIYYTPYTAGTISLYNGSSWQALLFSETSLILDSSGHTTGNIYDIFGYINSSALAIGTGPAWTVTTPGSASRGTGSGTTQLTRQNGVWVNAEPIVLRNNSINSSSIPAGQALYLGSFYCTSGGQTDIIRYPAAASSGNAPSVCLFNAYNRVQYSAQDQDSASWTYNSSTWRQAHGSSSNQILYLDGLAVITAQGTYGVNADAASGGATTAAVGVNLNSSVSTPGGFRSATSLASGTAGELNAFDEFYPVLGINYIMAVEAVTSGTATFNAEGQMALRLKAEY